MSKESKFLTLAKRKESLAKEMETIQDELTATMKELGYDVFVQDSETKAVYKTTKPKGKFMYFEDISYVRTALEGERAGSLSKKEAESEGFDLE